jgi:transcription antitermination factor NusG
MPILKREPDAFPDDVFDLASPWLVAHVRSRQEKALARYLGLFSVPFYLPQMEKRLRRSGRTVVSYLPLFAGYLFFRGGDAERQRALRSHLVVNILDASDQDTLHAELAQLRQLQLTDGRLVPHPYLAPGDVVAISEGAFKGYRGTVVREKGRERLVVSVTMIRQSVSVEIDRELLIPHLDQRHEHAQGEGAAATSPLFRGSSRSQFPGGHRSPDR